MSCVRVCGFYDPKTYILPLSVQKRSLRYLSVEEFSVVCRTHGGIDRVLYHIACQLSSGTATFLECISDTEDILKMHFGEREWVDLIQ